MIFKPVFTLKNAWLHDGSLADAIAWSKRIDEAPDVGYVYLLGYANGHTKVGATSYFPERLIAHQRDIRRWDATLTRCMVTRPAFNYRKLERTVKREFDHKQHVGEVFGTPISDIAKFIQFQPLSVVAPEAYSRSRAGANRFLMRLMAELSVDLGLHPGDGMQRYVQSILDRHTALGRATGLSERDTTTNALSVIEAHTGLDLSAFHAVLREAA